MQTIEQMDPDVGQPGRQERDIHAASTFDTVRTIEKSRAPVLSHDEAA